MANFTGTAGNDTANAALGQLSGFTGGTLAQLQDLVGDSIFGFAGDDYIFAGDGNDDIEGWDGHDIINGGAGNDEIWANQISDPDGSLIGDEITGNDGDDTIQGSGGGDAIDGSAGGDLIFGGGGDDFLQGGTGFDRIFGGAGGDTIYGSDLAATGEAASVFNSLHGEDGNDSIIGADRKDFITGGPGADALHGNGGDDEFYFYGGDVEGGEIIDGGAGSDALLLSASAPVHDLRLASISSIEALLIGLSANPGDAILAIFLAGQINAMPADLALISGTTFTSTLRIEMAGETSLDITGANLFSNWGNDDLIEVFGDADGETMRGAGMIDHLSGAGGNDVLDGGGGADLMVGGGQNDSYFVDNTGDAASELVNQGYDTVNTTLTSYTLGANLERVNATSGANFVGIGNALDNRFQALGGDDRFVDVLGGADTFSGGAGTDTVDFRSSAVAAVLNFVTNIHGGAALGDAFASIEKFLGSATGADRMTAGGTGRVIYAGFGGDDRLNGGVKNDQLLGDDGDDILKGNADRDSLQGGRGDDAMTGGSEGDVFVYADQDADFGRDTIADFQDGVDSFKVHADVANDVSDFTVTGNGTKTVTLALIVDAGNMITINGAAPVTITNADFVFY